MSAHWKSVLPVDRYVVRLNGLLHDYDRKVLTRLYQPLMGARAYSLYMTLWSETDEDSLLGEPSTHHSLMTATQMNLQQIFDQRRKLEALSLLKTFVNDGKEARTFIYQLEPPLLPDKFFQDDVLSVYLYNRIGKQKYDDLKKRFSIPSMDQSNYQEVTAAFDEAFRSVHYSELMPTAEIQEQKQLDEGYEWVGRHHSDGIHVIGEQFDFNLFMAHLSGLIVPKEAITAEVKETITTLAFVYNIEPLEMCRLVEEAYDVLGERFNVDALREKVREWYAFEYDENLPRLSFRTQPVKYQTMNGKEPKTESEKMAQAFETYSPFDILEQAAEGGKPAPADLKLVENLMSEQKLPAGVVNVLIDYVMKTQDMKLIPNYVKKIGAEWARRKIKTVEEAMNLATAENKKYQGWAPKKGSYKKSPSKKPKRKEPLPKWMTEKDQASEPDPEWDELRRQLEKELKDL
jgi:replication initiation and membrane attachment protein